ncbi:MAG TPA: alpha/beta fold hydrolase [Longimicrobiales bacterium]|nr:alpha/beta fold hydrolase [Longimicrobiales bacterium]
MASDYREEVFRTEGGLVGIVSIPAPGVDAGLPDVVILNAGNIHRVGAGRAAVRLARRLAGRGQRAVRFDHAGVGDSAPRSEGPGLEEGRVGEISEILTAMAERFDADRFIIYGLCTGARDAFHAALRDERIAGIVQIDGFAYRNMRFYLNKMFQSAGDIPAVLRGVGRRLGLVPRPIPPEPGTDMWVEEWSDYPPRPEVEEGYRTLVRRGVRMFVAFTGSWEEEYNYERQFLDMYPGVDFGDVLTLRYLPDAAHTLTDPVTQQAVVTDVLRWMDDAFATDRQLAS